VMAKGVGKKEKYDQRVTLAGLWKGRLIVGILEIFIAKHTWDEERGRGPRGASIGRIS